MTEEAMNLIGRMQGINGWIESNKENIGNANMFEIMDCAIKRNILVDAGETAPELSVELGRMVGLRADSIQDFLKEVPEANLLLTDVLSEKLCPKNNDEAELMRKSVSVPFFIYNSRKRGFDGDITRDGKGIDKPFPEFNHDNVEEVNQMVTLYNQASDEVKKVTYPLVNWTLQNCIDVIKNNLSVDDVNENKTSMHM